MAKTYISNYPNVSIEIKRYVDSAKVKFLFDPIDEDMLLMQFLIFHETAAGESIGNLDSKVELVADNNTQVYAFTGEYLEYDNSTMPPTLLHTATKGQAVGEFNFFTFLKTVPTVIDDLITFSITRADSLGRLNKYVK